MEGGPLSSKALGINLTPRDIPYASILHRPESEPLRSDPRTAFSMEEEATLLLWCWPELLGWANDLVWLFSPVVGKTWPGDLWGIDEGGNLVLVETKRATRPDDPMRDFVGYLSERPVRGLNPLFSFELVSARWERRLAQELSFIKRSLASPVDRRWWNDTHPGVVPYSSKRFAARKWPNAYLDIVAPKLSDHSYEALVRSRLASRNWASGPVHYVGLFGVPESGSPRLSSSGRANLDLLMNEVGISNVHLRAIAANAAEGGQIQLTAWIPGFNDA
jgi:hypothetical protein